MSTTDLSWSALLESCMNEQPTPSATEAVYRALDIVSNLRVLDEEWERSQRDFYSITGPLTLGVGTNISLPEDKQPQHIDSYFGGLQEKAAPIFFW